jgi:hypothetical protein
MSSIAPTAPKVNYADETFDTIMASLPPTYKRILDGLQKWQTDIRFSDAPIGGQPLIESMRLARGVRIAARVGGFHWTAPNTYTVDSENGHGPYTVTIKPGFNRDQPICDCPDWKKQAHNESLCPGPHYAIWCRHTVAVKVTREDWDRIIDRHAPPPPRTAYDDWCDWADMLRDDADPDQFRIFGYTNW